MKTLTTATLFFVATRKKLGFSQAKFAKVLGVTRNMAASYENARAKVPGPVVFKILELYYPAIFVYLIHSLKLQGANVKANH